MDLMMKTKRHIVIKIMLQKEKENLLKDPNKNLKDQIMILTKILLHMQRKLLSILMDTTYK